MQNIKDAWPDSQQVSSLKEEAMSIVNVISMTNIIAAGFHSPIAPLILTPQIESYTSSLDVSVNFLDESWLADAMAAWSTALNLVFLM